MWGYSLQFWQSIVFWLWVVTAVGGGMAVTGAFLSSVVAYYVSDETQKQADIRIEEAKTAAKQADEGAAVARKEAAEAGARAAIAEQRAAEANLTILRMKTPRSLSQLQSDHITNVAIAFKGTSFVGAVAASDAEADVLMMQIESSLLKAGLTEKDWVGSPLIYTRQGKPTLGFVSSTGVFVCFFPDRTIDLGAAAQAIVKALNDVAAQPG